MSLLDVPTGKIGSYANTLNLLFSILPKTSQNLAFRPFLLYFSDIYRFIAPDVVLSVQLPL
jgi:hypothetical protein